MKYRHVITVLTAALMMSFFAQASTTISKGENDKFTGYGKTHTLEIRCDARAGVIKISRLSILDVPGAKIANLDVGLTTAHGLLDNSGNPLEKCKIKDFNGQSYRLKSAEIPEDYQPGSPTDWAIIAFERAKKTNVIRYVLAAPLSTEEYDNLADDSLALMFSSARGLPDGEQNCNALPRQIIGMNTPRYLGLLPHDCRAIAGQSGAPLSITRQGKNVILGFHVGNAFWVGIPNKAQPAKHGYMRVVDNVLTEEINITVATLLETP